ncbi:response regulator, partial [Pseudomonas aeruginosa]
AAHGPRGFIASGMANYALAPLTGGRAVVIKPAASPAKPAPAPKRGWAPQASARPAGSGNPRGQAQLRLPQSSMPCVI